MRRLAAAALAAAALAGCGDEERGDLLLRADRVFDGERVLEPGEVLVRGGEIVAVGREVDGEAARTIELGAVTILPGFIDLHVHFEGHVLARGGLTTVRNLGGPLDQLLPLEEEWPVRVLSAGPILTAPGGYPIPLYGPEIAREVRGERRARAAVRDLARRGAEVIKIALELGNGWPLLTAGEVRAVVEEAHAHELNVTAHVSARRGVELALAGGVDRPLLRELVERDVEVVATLQAIDSISDQLLCEDIVDEARTFVSLGGELLYGTDIGVPGIPQTIDVTELRMLREAGLEPLDVLAAATSRAGEQLGLAPLGTLAEGAPADLIAVAGDARELPDTMSRPLLVVRGGRIVVDAER